MALGPELVAAQSVRLSSEYVGNKVRRAEAFDCWIALFFSRDRVLFFSWDAEFYGLCLASPVETRELEAVGRSRPPILGAIKSHIVGAELVVASAPGRDRVLRLDFRRALGAGVYQKRALILEASGRYSNLVLLDDDCCVAEAAKHIHPDMNRYRSILPGSAYVPPPPVDGIALEDFVPGSSDAPDDLNRVVGLGKPLLKAISANGHSAVDAVASLKNFDGPLVYQSTGKYVTVFPFLLDGACEIRADGALDAARSAVIVPLLSRHRERIKKKISGELAHANEANARKISEYESLAGDNDSAEELKQVGRLILENSWAIAPRSESAELTEWTDEGERKRTVKLDPKLDAAQNAEKYFTRYKKKRLAAERARKVLPELYARREEIDEQAALMECSNDASVLSMMLEEMQGEQQKTPKAPKNRKAGKKTPSLPPHRRMEFPDFSAVLFWGLSAKGNRYVTFRLARPDDVWLHARNIPGAHVILRFDSTPDEAAYDRMIEMAAACAAYYSKAGESGRVPVDFTERKQVRGIPGGGVANVTYKDYSTTAGDASMWPGIETGADTSS